MTDLERLRADRDAAVYAALNTFDAVVYADRDAALDAALNAFDAARAASVTYLAAHIAAQIEGADDDQNDA
jgi:hypothetical protein